MQFSDITNLERVNIQLKTKIQSHCSPKKKPRFNPMDMSNFRFEWVCLDENEYDTLTQETLDTYNFTKYEQTLWFQNQHTHFHYPLQFDHSNTQESLKKHKIDEIKRHSLFCWMGYVMGSYDTASNETYFLAISIFDKFLSLYPISLNNQQLLSIGICCLGLASKQKDIYCLTSQQLMQLSGSKMDEMQLTKCSIAILQTIDYQVEQPNFFMCFDYLLRDLEYRYYRTISSDISMQTLGKQKLTIIYRCSLILMRFVTQYYDCTMHKFSTVAFGCIYYTIKRMELLQLVIPKVFLDILEQIQSDQGITHTELILKYICKLCQNGMSEKQLEFLPQTTFIY